MGCVLRVSGRRFDVDAFLSRSRFKPCAVWRKGGQRPGRKALKHTDSGFNLVVSEADGPRVDIQIQDAVRFLKRNRTALAELRNQPGVEHLILDFGIQQRSAPAQFDHFPAALVAVAGELGMGLELSRYAVDDAS
jgi:hypothetical protein